MSTVADAAYDTVHEYPGGAEALGPRVAMSPKVLDSRVNPNIHIHHLSLNDAVRIMALTGDHRILRAQCRHLGYLDPIRAVVYEGIADEQLLELVTTLHAETGDVSRSLQAALRDGRVTAKEYEDFHNQLVESWGAGAELDDRLRGMVIEEPVRLRKVSP